MIEEDHKLLSEKFMATICSLHQNFFRQTPIPLPANHFMVLVIVQNEGSMTISQLCERMVMSKQQMTPIIDKLVKNGYIYKETMPEDRRCTKIYPTDAGLEVLEQHTIRLRQRFEKNLCELAPEEIHALAVSLDTVSASIDKMFHPSLVKKK